ncbi:class I SAM-dependent methyltransferase [Kitasatospora sp. NPDC089797]|uniref:class I SAM-dependent methyltransferase n=1 Tax=Kitasatospora sp. NPDC089797 TaxID=3155298 RepID=UPI003418DF8F
MNAPPQYGTAVASVYDSLIGSAVPVGQTVERLRPYVTGARVLEIGVGTGRVALPVSALAARLVGLDNSRPMLDEFRRKAPPANVSLVEADFGRPLPLTEQFDTAYSTMGSLACVRTREELTAALTHIRAVLVPGARLCLEYYAAEAYRPLAEQGTFTVPTVNHRGSTTTFTVALDAADLLTMDSRVVEPDGTCVEFTERVLLIDRTEVSRCLAAAGFVVDGIRPGGGTDPYDWYTAHLTS